MKSQTKAMEIIRKKQEKAEAARRKQVEAERKGEKVEFEDIGGAKEPRTPSTIHNFVFYLPLLAAFGVSFGLIFGPASDFSSSRVFLKVVAMFIGEIDYGDIDTDSTNGFAFICKFLLMLSFIFAFSLTLVNLLNGLAVSDIR